MTLIKFTNLRPFYFPEEGVDDGIPKGTSDKDDVIKFLSEDDEEDDTIDLTDKKDKKEDKKDKDDDKDEKEDKDDKKDDKDEDKDEEDKDGKEEEEEDEDDELKELEEELDELEDPDEDKLELTTPVSRREILKEYPKLFEKFPYLEKAYYREQQYTKHFPNPADAENAVQSVEVLGKLEADLADGNITRVLKAVKDANPKAFAKMVNGYLPKLAEVDKEAYHHIFGNVTKHLIHSMAMKGKNAKDEDLMQAAETLNKFIFQTDEFEPPKEFGEGIKDEDKTAEAGKKKEQEILEANFKKSVDEVTDKVRGTFKRTITANIDTKDQMTSFVKEAAVDKALNRLEGLINRDTRFKSLVDRLWEQHLKDGLSKTSLDKVNKAFISKAKSLLPSVLKEARLTALKGMGTKSKKAKDENNDDEDRNDKREQSSRRSRTPDSKSTKGKVPDGMSTLEYLMSDD